MNKKKNIIYYSFIIAILNIFDGYATNYGLKNNYIGESNPIMDYLWKVHQCFFNLKNTFIYFSHHYFNSNI